MPPLLAFTGLQVGKLTGLSQSTLRYWEETDVFRATYIDDQPRRPYRRIYTFRDLVSLRTLALLRRKYGIKLDELRKVGRYLRDHYESPWAEVRFWIHGKHVVFEDPESGGKVAGRPFGQAYIPIEFDEIRRETEAAADEFRRRDPEDIGRITRHRYIMSNAWRLAGTRIPTSTIWHFWEDGYDLDGIMQAYPDLTPEDITAALDHERELRGLSVA
jgi:DNA-binding transcriptional MerR regulator